MHPTVPTVTVPALTGEVHLLDVREDDEWAAAGRPLVSDTGAPATVR